MEYKDFIKPGEKVIHLPERMDDSLWPYEPQVVTIGQYRPYYTDDTPDPTPEEYNECCHVEIEGETTYGESQLSLESLLPIVKEEKEVLYNSKLYKTYGYDEEDDYAVLINDESMNDDVELMVVDADECCEHRDIDNLSREEYMQLRSQISVGSIYTSDYINTLGLTSDEVQSLSDEYLEYIETRDIPDSQKTFADFCIYGEDYFDNCKKN